jgi:CRP-like cAMP-binding protein
VSRAELIGPGDVILYDESSPAQWQVIQPAELAVLNESLRRWPAVVDALLRRAADRTHAFAVQLAIAGLRRSDDRLLTLFRALAERWGQRTQDGIAIPVPLTHETIALLAGVHRPAVRSALRRLEHEGRLRRPARDRWLLADACERPGLPLAA